VAIGVRFTTWAPIVVLAIMVGLTYWLERVIESNEPDIVGPSRSDPDIIVNDISALSLDQTGQAEHSLMAKKLVHYPDDDATLITEPRFVSYSGAEAPVSITSKQGVVSSNGDHVYFQDDVRVVRAAYDDQSELTLRTSFLHVIPDAHVAKTDRQVTILDGATVVTAVGLELNTETRELKLLSNVQGTYDPAKAPGHREKP
jgi:lipopolysaccharide export system protein LptC